METGTFLSATVYGLITGLDWTGLDWTGLDWTGLDYWIQYIGFTHFKGTFG